MEDCAPFDSLLIIICPGITRLQDLLDDPRYRSLNVNDNRENVQTIGFDMRQIEFLMLEITTVDCI